MSENSQNLFVRFYQAFQALSLDVMIGAVVTSVFLAKQMGVTPTPYSFWALGLTVWLIYTFDHLTDAAKISGQALSYRHRLHQVFFLPIAIVAACVAIADIFCILHLPIMTIYWGLIGAVAVAMYFLVMRVRPSGFHLGKEPTVALTYVFGVLLPPFSISQVLGQEAIVLGLMLFGTALSNLFLFAAMEIDVDCKEGHPSIAKSLGSNTSLRLFTALSTLVLASAMLYSIWDFAVGLVFGAMAMSLLAINLMPSQRRKYAYRVVGDGVFLLPGIALLILG